MLQFAYTLLVPWCVVHVEQKTCNDAFNNNKEKENYNSQGVNEQSKHASLPALHHCFFTRSRQKVY